jgi:SpoVK/Ycf46/Vps4 family AAA+-type ATPase
MARGDLLINLVRASVAGDKNAVRSAVETIIAEEKNKQHTVLADRLTRVMQANGNVMNKLAPVSESGHKGREFIAEITPKRELGDIVLSETCRTAVDQLIEEQQRSSLLRAHGLDPRHRLLLVGPPGNGKTSLAEAIAEALAVPFFVVRYEAMIGSYLGETASRLKRVFDYVRTTPCVLFFDEFDAVGKERGDIHETGEIKRVVTSLLMHVDELPSYAVVIAATNHSELLDRAVWRRFQFRLGLHAPGERELTEYFDRFLASFDKRPGITAPSIAKRLGAISYAEAEEFTLDVRRRDVMTMKERPLRKTIEEQLKLWQERVQPSRTDDTRQDVPDG